MRLEPAQHDFGIPLEESDQVQVADDQHHREQQDDGLEVDVLDRVGRSNDAKGDHSNGADDGRARSVDFEAGELARMRTSDRAAGEKLCILGPHRITSHRLAGLKGAK